MAKYLIHSCVQREWYVDKYLVPSMIAQGINEEDITVYVDHGLGNLKAFLDSLEQMIQRCELWTGTWHLQDDIIISSDFREITERFNNGIVGGFKSVYDKTDKYWYSFPCIRIPNTTAWDFLRWTKYEATKDVQLAEWIKRNKYDDSLFREYMERMHQRMTVLDPNIVNHIGDLLGNSLVNPNRQNTIIRSVLWKEDWLIDDLKRKLEEDK